MSTNYGMSNTSRTIMSFVIGSVAAITILSITQCRTGRPEPPAPEFQAGQLVRFWDGTEAQVTYSSGVAHWDRDRWFYRYEVRLPGGQSTVAKGWELSPSPKVVIHTKK